MNTLQIFLGICLLFVISMYQSCSEMRLSLFGKKEVATVGAVMMEYNTKTREPTGKYLIEYNFNAREAQEPREVRGEYATNLAEAESRNKGDKLDVLYLTSSPTTHRVAGHAQIWWVVLFFLFLAGLTYQGIKLFREAQQDVVRMRRR